MEDFAVAKRDSAIGSTGVLLENRYLIQLVFWCRKLECRFPFTEMQFSISQASLAVTTRIEDASRPICFVHGVAVIRCSGEISIRKKRFDHTADCAQKKRDGFRPSRSFLFLCFTSRDSA